MVSPLRRVTFEERESNQSALAPPLGASLRLGMPLWERACSRRTSTMTRTVWMNTVSRVFREQARSHKGLGTSARDTSAARPSSLRCGAPTNQLPQGIGRTRQNSSSVSSPRRLLILIHPPLREAEGRCSSGEWRAAPFDAVEHAAYRCSEANRRAVSPDGCRSEGTPSLGEGPDAGASLFGYFFGV
ncbi:hypothetical protein BJ917_0625 [Pseudomonas sp. WPR_5_2]|nr:hypothetical protein BJ917_0625 [Pseudomonas sp. WPR_5_2]